MSVPIISPNIGILLIIIYQGVNNIINISSLTPFIALLSAYACIMYLLAIPFT